MNRKSCEAPGIRLEHEKTERNTPSVEAIETRPLGSSLKGRSGRVTTSEPQTFTSDHTETFGGFCSEF